MSFFAALKFLTIIPVPWRGEVRPEELRRSISYFPVVGVIIGLILCIALVGYVIRNKEPPEKVELAIREPEVRTETEYVLTRLFRFFFEESKHPLRILVMGNYDDLKYTDRIFTTSREMTLREAVLLPRQS